MRRAVLAVLALLITYGSLYPFHFAMPGSHAAAWEKLLFDWTPFTSRGDALGNFALFVPFGFAGVFAAPGRARAAPGIPTIVLLSLVLATALQIVQIYFPPRTPAMADVIWNMIGAGFGILAGWLARDRLQLRPHAWRDAYAIPTALLVLWISAELLPFVPSIDLQAIKNSVKALIKLHLAPQDILWHAAGALIAGCALKAIFGPARAVKLLGALIIVVLAGKVLVVSRLLNASTVVGLALGYAAWVFAWGGKRPLRGESVVPLLALAAYTLKALEPFEFRSAPEDMSWLPFARMLQGSMIINTMVLVESIFMFAAVLGLISMRGPGLGASTFMLTLWVGALEGVQMFLVGRTPDITEPLLVVLVGMFLRYLPAAHSPGRRQRPERGNARAHSARTTGPHRGQ